MARQRWTLALILICLPILATVITAFRVRDLPKSNHESSKSELKKPRKCVDCDVKIGQNLHNGKIESDKQPYEELKKVIREKQPHINQNIPVTKSIFKFDIYSDSDEEDDDEIGFLNIKTGFRQEYPKSNKHSKIGLEVKPESSSKKLSLDRYDDEDEDDIDDSDDDDEDDDDKSPTVLQKPKMKIVNKIKPNPKSSEIESQFNKLKQDDDIEDNDDNDDNVEEEEDNYDGIENIEELFKILDARKKPDLSLKKDNRVTTDKVLTTLTDHISKDSHNEDEEVNDDDNNLLKKVATKVPLRIQKPLTKEMEDKKEQTFKKSDVMDEQESIRITEKKIQLKENIAASGGKDTKVESIKKEIKLLDKDKKGKHILDKPINEKVLTPPVIKKEDKNKQIETKTTVVQPKLNSAKKPKNMEKDILKPKSQGKEDKHETQEVASRPEVTKKDKILNNKTVQSKKDIEPEFEKKDDDKDLINKENTSEEKLSSSQEILSKSENNLKYVTDALRRRNLLKSEFEDFYAFFPTFAPNFSRVHNPECRRHGQIVLRQLRGTKLWALNMLDATAKIPSGILQGNGIQLGDFDQCLESRARVQLDTGSVVRVQGKYCLARIDVKAEHPELEVPVHLAQAKNLIRSRIDDPGHFVPRFSTLSWGVCVPTACNSEDVEVVIKDAIKHYQYTSGVVLRVKVDEQDCHTEQGADWWEDWLALPTILTLSFYGIIVMLVFVATIQDLLAKRSSDEIKSVEESDENAACDQKETQNEKKKEGDSNKRADSFISAFSLYQTISKLVASGTTDEISCIHGVRGIATIALLVAHKFLPVAVMPYTNRLKISETASSFIWSWCRAGWMHTDCFLLLSGTLTAHRISTDSDNGALRRLFSRYLRLTPALLAVVLFYAYVWDNVSSGPMWGTFVTKNAEVCQQGWWWNVMYVQNYFGFAEMCAPQTHQLALDMQLTIIGGIIVWMIQSNSGLSKVLLPSIHILAVYSRYSTVRDHRLTLLAYHGVSVSQLYRTAHLSYASALHRSTPYLVGLSLGLALKKPARHGKVLQTLGWIISGMLWGLVLWAGIDSGSPHYRYSATFAAQYAALAPIASATAIAWLIYAVHNGSCDFLYRLLCCRGLVFVSRLSYALYLCQFIIFNTNIGTVKTSREFTIMSLIDLQEISAIFISSTILTLTFVIPMQSLQKVFYFSSNIERDETKQAIDSKEKIKREETKREEVDKATPLQTKNRQHLLAHREVLEEIPEVEVEYEMQRENNEGLDEIIEDDELGEEETQNHFDDDLEIIEEEQAGEEAMWEEREEYSRRRTYSREDDQDLDEWEWTVNGNGRNGAQHYRFS